MKVNPLVRGECPCCNKIIMNPTKTSYINGGMEFSVRFNDGSKANFGICEDCLSTLTQEQANEIMKRQIVSWGVEIEKQLQWFHQVAVHLKITEWSK